MVVVCWSIVSVVKECRLLMSRGRWAFPVSVRTGGSRAHGREIGRTSQQKKARIGYDYVHSVVDDHSRFAYSEILDDEQGDTCAGFFARALEEFAAHRITITEVMTDNHWSYTRSA